MELGLVDEVEDDMGPAAHQELSSRWFGPDQPEHGTI